MPHYKVLWLPLLSLALGPTALADFVHPGVSHSGAGIRFVKANIEKGERPWAEAWDKPQASRYADLDWTPQPRTHVERGPSNDSDIGSSDFSRDATAAYIHALLWSLSGEEAHAH